MRRGVLLADLVPFALATVRHAGTASAAGRVESESASAKFAWHAPRHGQMYVRDGVPVMNCAKSSKKRLRLAAPKFRGVAAPAERQVDQG